ncbi:MAG: hypothetical protein ACK5MU_04140 [Candidatus Saccharimonadales bacterium]
MTTKQKIGAILAAVIFLVLLIIASTIDAEVELGSMNNEPVTSCNAYSRTCFTR